ncbi:MAG: twin-arginine translocase subunit TatC [Spirochaetia bacterium]|nr:twin-arginine translocase subunit TatC [Spirochaetia bacterium]
MDVHDKEENNRNINEPVPYNKKANHKKKSENSGDHEKKSGSNAAHEKEKYQKKILKQNRYMPVIDHIEEFRWTILRSLVWLVVFSAVSMIFYNQIFKILINPIGNLIDYGKSKDVIVKLIVTKLSDYVLIQFKLSFIAGLLFAVPAIFYEIIRFIMPAFDKKYKKWSYLVLFFSILFFWSGIYIAWRYCWDIVIKFLVFNWIPPGIDTLSGIQMPEVLLTMSDYFSFFLGFHLTFGISFQLPIICVLLTVAGLISTRMYFKQWRIIILVIVILSAVIAPPDVLSMTAMTVPLFLLYLISGLFVFIFEKRTAK